jgi:hypothetical protein
MRHFLRNACIALTLITFACTSTKHEQAAEIYSSNHLKQIFLAFHDYHDKYGVFPPATVYSKDGKTPLYSWRVAILPFLDDGEDSLEKLQKEFKLDEAWDSENNKKLLDKMPKVYAPMSGKPKDKTATHYQVLVGGGAMFDDKKELRTADVTDGEANTIMIVEAEEAVPWTKPDDLTYDPDKPLPKFGGLFNDGFHAMFADGKVRFIKKDTDEKLLRALITKAGGEKVDLKQLK